MANVSILSLSSVPHVRHLKSANQVPVLGVSPSSPHPLSFQLMIPSNLSIIASPAQFSTLGGDNRMPMNEQDHAELENLETRQRQIERQIAEVAHDIASLKARLNK